MGRVEGTARPRLGRRRLTFAHDRELPQAAPGPHVPSPGPGAVQLVLGLLLIASALFASRFVDLLFP